MTIGSALDISDISHTDSEILLAALLRHDRSWIIAHDDEKISEDDEKEFLHWIDRRKKNEPISYITGEKEFYGRKFFVDRRVLIPRPATEGLVELALSVVQNPADQTVDIDTGIVAVSRIFKPEKNIHTIVDIGAGSGCIAITMALENPDLKIIATDSSSDALDVARDNAKRLNVSDRITFLEGNLLDPIQNLTEPFLIVSNPPYIPEGRELMPDVRDYEPSDALYGGKDGTDVIRKIMEGAAAHQHCTGVILECEKDQISATFPA